MLFLKIKTILSAKQRFAHKYERMRGLVLLAQSSHPVYIVADVQRFLPRLTPSCPEERVWRSLPHQPSPPLQWQVSTSAEMHPGPGEQGLTPLIPSVSYLASLEKTFRWGDLKLRINRSPLLLLSGSQWRILSAEQRHGNQFLKHFLKNTSEFHLETSQLPN